MDELDKLNETKYFYSKMICCQENPIIYKYNLSAFPSASRSVLQYIYERSKNNDNIRVWYDSFVSKSKIIKYFKCKRDINIHVKPIIPNVQINASFHDTIAINDYVEIKLLDEYGNIKGYREINYNQQERKESELPRISYEYRFSDWTGNEDVITLSEKYLDELNIIIEDGQNKGFLS